MKNLVVTVIVAIIVMASFSQVQAQYAIPSYDVSLNTSGITFEDNELIIPNSREERKIFVEVEVNGRSQQKVVVFIKLYKLDGSMQTAPIRVEQGHVVEFLAGDEAWGVQVMRTAPNSKMSVWTN